jgi:spermidine synthase
VLTSKEKFDVITTDPINPWVKGAASLYTREFFELAKRHLKPGGVMTQWVPLYETTSEAVKSEFATFFSVFPEGLAWINDRDGGADVVLLGQADPAPIKVGELEERLKRPDYARVVESLTDVDFLTEIDLLSTYIGRGRDLAAWLKGAALNTDRDLRLQYLAGMGVNGAAEVQLYQELLEGRRFPDGLFEASAKSLAMLREAIEIKESDPAPAEQR